MLESAGVSSAESAMRIDGLIFDLDGTLADTFPVIFTAFREATLAYLGRALSDAEIVATFGPSEVGIIQRLVPDRWEACLAAYLAAYDRAHFMCPAPFPGIDRALALLRRRGVNVAVVTGKGPESATRSLRYLGLLDRFDAVETGVPEAGIKPRSIARVLERWRVAPDHVAYVGDAVGDVHAAREAGVLAFAAAWAPGADAAGLAAAGAHATFRAVDELIDWIERSVGARG
jgi:phosphoglycolate phosphatase-like HAD superfamily hydrolase